MGNALGCSVLPILGLLLSSFRLSAQFGWPSPFPNQNNNQIQRSQNSFQPNFFLTDRQMPFTPTFASSPSQFQQQQPQRRSLPFPTFGYPPPQTSFSCSNIPEAGFYADLETGCQVIRRCTIDKFMFSFLCPNGTIFDQASQSCDYWFKVECSQEFLNDVVFPKKRKLNWRWGVNNLVADDESPSVSPSISTVMSWVGIEKEEPGDLSTEKSFTPELSTDNGIENVDAFPVLNPLTTESTNTDAPRTQASTVLSSAWIPLMQF